MNVTTLAVIIGRYQTFQLHSEQIRMISEVVNRHSKTILILGNSLMRGTINNPLEFRARKTMIQEHFPKMEVFYINDIPKNNVEWSVNLDNLIEKHTKPNTTVSIYGGKETVVKKYTGRYSTFTFEASNYISADELRRQANSNYQHNEQFRAGVIAAQIHRFPTSYQTVDVAIVDDAGRLLLGRKPNETKWRFIGGFSDPNSPSLESDARREASEETGVEVDFFTYLGSLKINDSRYIGEVDCIKTVFFVGKYIFGRPQGNDDIAEVAWIPIKDLNKNDIGEFHHVLVDMFMEKFVKNETLYKKYVTT
jgi:bifunctional NMN adenylyltransferase/nudix hydrolase